MGTQSSLGDSSGVLSMLVLVVLSMCLALHTCMPASQSPGVEVMPKLQLAYLVEDGQYRQPDMARLISQLNTRTRTEVEQRVKRQFADQISTVNTKGETVSTVNTEVEAAAEQNNEASTTENSSRDDSFNSAIARILAAAGAKPTPIDPEARSYAGRRRRSPQIEPPHSNAHQYGLIVPNVDKVKVKSHGSFGREVHAPVVVVRKDHTNFLNGAKERRKRSDNFIPFSLYDDRRRKTLKIEENDAHALPLRLQIEKKEQLARQARAKALKVQSSKTQ